MVITLLYSRPEMKKTLSADISKFGKISTMFEGLMNKVGVIDHTLRVYCTDK